MSAQPFTPQQYEEALAGASTQIFNCVQNELDKLRNNFGVTPGSVYVRVVDINERVIGDYEPHHIVTEVELRTELRGSTLDKRFK
jgi:hypothetical protein